MLLRLYRITDKMGLLTVRLGAALGDACIAAWGAGWRGLGRLVRGGVGGVLGIFTLIFAALAWLLTQAWALLRGLGRLVALVASAAFGLLGMVGKTVAKTASNASRVTKVATSQAARTSTAAMARRAERTTLRQQMDVKLAEDPLRIQNRRLSLLVIVLGMVAVAAVLWATDPNRRAPTIAAASDGGGSLLLASTPNAASTPDGGGAIALPTVIPTATPVPQALRAGGTLAYAARERGQTDIWAVGIGSRNPIRLTNSPEDERDPIWSADGTRIAYASRQDGSWDLYILDVVAQTTTRITYDLSFQGNPRWSPDDLWLVYESYQGDNLDVYAAPIDGSQAAVRISDDPAPDFSPVWSPDGRRIAFVSWREGNQDIYLFDLDSGELNNLTRTPNRNEDHPAWSPDGRLLAFSALDQGSEKVFVQAADSAGGAAEVVNFGRTPNWSPDGQSLTFAVDASDGLSTYLYAVPIGGGGVATEVVNVPYGSKDPTWSSLSLPPNLVNSGGLPLGVAEPLFVEQEQRFTTGATYRLSALPDVEAPSAYLSDRVNDSFDALRRRVLALSNDDFLSRLDDAFWNLERRPEPGEDRRSWYMTGRAFAIRRDAILGFPPQIEVIREDVGVYTQWRIFLRVDDEAQSGQLGEPLRVMPWDFLAATQGDVQAFNEGGRLRREVPTGYYVDLTQVASDYGWLPYPAGGDWRANVAARNYWYFVKQEGLAWYNAMLEIHTEGELVNFAPTAQPGA